MQQERAIGPPFASPAIENVGAATNGRRPYNHFLLDFHDQVCYNTPT